MAEKCKYCEKDALVKVGKDSVPLCEEHFIKFLQGARTVLDCSGIPGKGDKSYDKY